MRPNYDNIYILSDSKGKYLKGIRYNIADVIRHVNVSQLHFWFKNGQKSADGLRYLESQTNNLRRPGRTIVLFWHVICDLSTLKRPEIYIVNSFETAGELLEHLRPTFDGLEEIHKRANFDIGIYKTPPIFWHKWNQQHGDTDWEGKDNTLMHSQSNAVNEYIRGVNQRLNYRSPMFICDCMEFRKSKGQHGHIQSLTSELFSDGVHPIAWSQYAKNGYIK